MDLPPHPLLQSLLNNEPQDSGPGSFLMGLMYIILIYHGGRKAWLLDWTEYESGNNEGPIAMNKFIKIAKLVGLSVSYLKLEKWTEPMTFISKHPINQSQITNEDIANYLGFTCKHYDEVEKGALDIFGVHLKEKLTGIPLLSQTCLGKYYTLEDVKDPIFKQAEIFTHILQKYIKGAQVKVVLDDGSEVQVESQGYDDFDTWRAKGQQGDYSLYIAQYQARVLRQSTPKIKELVGSLLEAPWQYLKGYLQSPPEQRNINDVKVVFDIMETLRNSTEEMSGGKKHRKKSKGRKRTAKKSKSKKRRSKH
jgi:hypothetical protein